MTLPWSEVPAEEKARLQANLNAHRRRAAAKGLPAEDIRVDELLAKLTRSPLGYLCACGQVLAFGAEVNPQRPDKATVGHHFPLSAPANELHPGHSISNTDFECWACNSSQNHTQDTPGIAKGKKMAVQHDRPKKRASGSFWKPANRKSQWPKGRKIQSRGFGQ